MKVNKTAVACLIAAAAFVCGAAHAQNYPNKLVRFIVTYPPGGSSDVMARIIGQKLTEYWGQTVLIESRPGADGSIGMEYAAKQPADGYVMVLGNFGPVVAKPLLSKVSYDWQKDFAPVTRITISANILVVPKTLPVQRVKDLAALAKRYPGKLTYATSGPGSMSHFAGEMFKRLAGVDMITVPYKGNENRQAARAGGYQRAALAVHARTANARRRGHQGLCRRQLVGHPVSGRRAARHHRQG
jgi:tripartite-type tricarboxylate transporter receptor subunit TctC